MSDLRKKIIRLANAKPELRKDLLPLLQRTAAMDPEDMDDDQAFEYFEGLVPLIQKSRHLKGLVKGLKVDIIKGYRYAYKGFAVRAYGSYEFIDSDGEPQSWDVTSTAYVAKGGDGTIVVSWYRGNEWLEHDGVWLKGSPREDADEIASDMARRIKDEIGVSHEMYP